MVYIGYYLVIKLSVVPITKNSTFVFTRSNDDDGQSFAGATLCLTIRLKWNKKELHPHVKQNLIFFFFY